jgi:hypothetical protein
VRAGERLVVAMDRWISDAALLRNATAHGRSTASMTAATPGIVPSDVSSSTDRT